MIYAIIANLIYAGIDIFALAIIVSAIFTIDKHGKIKLTYDIISKKLSKYKSTAIFVCCFIFLSFGYFFISNSIQDKVLVYITALGGKTIPLLISIISFDVFYITKINLGRRWKFPLVIYSLIITIVSFLVTGYLIYTQ